ncbi:MAG: hypothetical protein A07HR60_01524 [uncultured archaeon A07HR60]|jgi:hypothetical protein|nr:MAG: hypothetical protein A07HR60_01524 [uncultured archaeon A07HR60]
MLTENVPSKYYSCDLGWSARGCVSGYKPDPEAYSPHRIDDAAPLQYI